MCGQELADIWTRATDTEYGTTRDWFAYYECRACDCLSIHPVPAGRLDEIYPQTYYSFAGGGYRGGTGLVTKAKEFLDERHGRRVLDLLPAADATILDVGGGTGDMSASLVRVSGGRATATVVDIDRASIEVARSRGLRGVVSRFEDFEPDRLFSVVLMINLIEHVADPVGMLRKASTLLEPHGLVWLQTPNFRSLDARLFRHRNWTGLHCPRHWTLFGERGLRDVLARAGLQPELFEWTQAGSFWAGSVLGMRRVRHPPSGPGLPKPLVRSPCFLPLAAAGAAFDLVTRRLRPTSQVLVLARSPEANPPVSHSI